MRLKYLYKIVKVFNGKRRRYIYTNNLVYIIQRKSHNYGWITLACLILSESKVWGGSQCR
ncbi:hypothetical protein COD21_07520 [Bacillus cereus]|nr:hypothetical protein COD21_07520 [Bacillus cereus]